MKKLGFTLSEVLMTLAILGVVAAITIPMISQNKKNHEYKTGYKKAISTINQALEQHYALEGMTVQDYVSAEELVNYLFKARMNTIDGTSVFTNTECENNGDSAVFTTADGMIFCISNFATDTENPVGSTCDMNDEHPCTDIDGPNLWIDVNGERKPNKLTLLPNHPKDIFQAQIYAHKIVPYGDAETKIILGNDDKDTSSNKNNNNTSNGNSGTHQGQGSSSNNNNEDNSQNQDNNQSGYNPDENYGNNNSGDHGNNNKPNPNNPEKPTPPDPNEEDENIDGEDNNQDNVPDENNPYYDQWDPNKWPSWLEFLKWILKQIAEALTP